MDTIAAISTPKGKGGIAVIRISGSEAIAVAKRVFLPYGNTQIDTLDGNRCIYGTIVDGDERIDDGVLTLFRAPRSYTGEDTVELSCHGGVLVTARVLEATLNAGAVMAGAGEFTKRAFLGGKITLTEAEAVGGMIDAKTDAHLRISQKQLRGSLSGVLYLENIGADVPLSIGDVVLTSGLGGSYVSGLLIGTIVRIEGNEADGVRTVVVAPNEQTSSLEEVMVVFSAEGASVVSSITQEAKGASEGDAGEEGAGSADASGAGTSDGRTGGES